MGVRWINNNQQLFPTPAGRAIYDAPTGGNLLLVMPFATPYARGRLPWDAGDVGHLRLFLPHCRARAAARHTRAGLPLAQWLACAATYTTW